MEANGGTAMTATAQARPDLGAYDKAYRLDFPVVLKELSRIVGTKLVAYIAGVGETRAVKEWIDGSRSPKQDVEPKLRLTLQVAETIAAHDNAGVARAWLQGLNPHLDDRSPARLLREGDYDEVGPQITAALRSFIVGG